MMRQRFTKKQVRAVYDEGIAYMREYGWCRGTYFRDAGTATVVKSVRADDGRLPRPPCCILGALIVGAAKVFPDIRADQMIEFAVSGSIIRPLVQECEVSPAIVNDWLNDGSSAIELLERARMRA